MEWNISLHGTLSFWPTPNVAIGIMSVADDRFAAAVATFQAANSADPHVEVSGGVARPREALYAERLARWVLQLAPAASEALRLASWCQHLCRWEIPRSAYEMSRAGYLRWRNDLKMFHARKAGEILAQSGYPTDVIRKVQALNTKANFPHDPESRVLEDALCLVFLQFQLVELADRLEPAKVVNALRKSWLKMTPQARGLAKGLSFPPREKALLMDALREEDRPT